MTLMDFTEKIAELLHKELDVEKKAILGIIESPPDPKLGDYAVPCFIFAKQLKKSPQIIAQELAEKLTKKNIAEDHQHFTLITSNGPYLNFFINKGIYTKTILAQIMKEKDQYGAREKQKERVMIEFSQPNTHKEFHVGHLRNISIGDSLVRIYCKLGYTVIAANYIGDMGSHVAKTLWCYLRNHANDEIPANRGKYLGRIYAESSRLIDEDVGAKEEVSQILQKLEQKDPATIALWKETREWSLQQFKSIYDELGVHFDIYFFESEEEEEGKSIVKELQEKHIVTESEGALLVDLKPYKLDVFLVLKSDGTSLYATKDLALAQKKFEQFNIDKSYYVVDTRQSFYFQQLFKTLDLMGFKKDMHHIAYDFVTTKNGPMASRQGNVILYEDLKEKVLAKLESETKKRHPDWSPEKIRGNASIIMYSALKFGMLKYDTNRIIVFDFDEWLSFDGETGPYIEYSYARINSIFRKLAKEKEIVAIEEFVLHADATLLQQSNEIELVKTLAKYPQVVENAAKEFKPSTIAHYLLGLTQQFNEFYHANPILTAEEHVMKARLLLIYCIRFVLQSGMDLLGFEAIEEM